MRTKRTLVTLAALLALGAAALPAAAQAQPAQPSAGAKPANPFSGPVVNGFTTIQWEALVPPDWDPFKALKGGSGDLAGLNDGDPRAQQALRELREVWDNAPANPAVVGRKVRIPGFVVPLEEGKDGLREFLLVPYFGACIHSPPPPANQIVHVVPGAPAKFRSMDAVWISGVIKTVRTDSYMGAASYRIEAQSVVPYQEQK